MLDDHRVGVGGAHPNAPNSGQGSRFESMIGEERRREKIDQLPPIPSQPDRNDPTYALAAKFWDSEGNAKYVKQRAAENLPPAAKWDNIIGLDGKPVGKKRLDEMFDTTFEAFELISYLYLDTFHSWSTHTPIVEEYFKRLMYTSFPDLLYCSHDIKLRDLGSARYSEFQRSKIPLPRVLVILVILII
jgi:hypothetical protein